VECTVICREMAVFFIPQQKTAQKQAQQSLGWTLASVALTDAFTDFILSRQAMNCTSATLEFYNYTAGAFLFWIESQGITDPADVTARHVRAYLAQLIAKGRKDTTLHANARTVRTLLRFWHAEGYTPQPVPFDIPRLEKKRLRSGQMDHRYAYRTS
jgi:site-specific recombinase XerD